jgi:hypothetical protein
MAKTHAPAPGSGIKDPRKYIELPYVVKGMDVSFSGLLTYIGEGGRVSGIGAGNGVVMWWILWLVCCDALFV